MVTRGSKMKRGMIATLFAMGATTPILFAACGSDDSGADRTTGAGGSAATSGGGSSGAAGKDGGADSSGGSSGSGGTAGRGGYGGSAGKGGYGGSAGGGGYAGPAYWASPTGAAAWANCKSQTPLNDTAACPLATANSNATAGDLVFLRGGTYTTSIAPAKDGTDSARLVFAGYGAEDAKITGPIPGIMVSKRAHITIDSVDVDGARTFADMTTAHDIWILNSTLINSSDTGGWPVGIRMYDNAHHNWISNCTIGNSGHMTSNDDIGGVINVGNWQNPTETTGYNLIENNHFYHGGHHILEVASSYNIFRNNVFHNENWTSCPRGSTGNLCGNRDIGLYRDELNANWNVFEGNRIAFAGASIDDTAGSSGLSVRSPHTIVRNNMFYFNDGIGMGLYVDSTQTYDSRHNYVYHNVFYRNGVSPLSAGDLRYTFGLTFDNVAGNSAPMPITDCAIKNNLFFNNVGGDIFFYYTDYRAQSVNGNYFGVARGSDATGLNQVNLPGDNIQSADDPQFLDVSMAGTIDNIDKFDFRAQAGSPVVDRGVFLTTTTSDGSGVVVAVQDANYFIDGFGIVPGDEIQLQGQTQTARIVSIDYVAKQITVDIPLSWSAGQGVAMKYQGSAPDVGAFER